MLKQNSASGSPLNPKKRSSTNDLGSTNRTSSATCRGPGQALYDIANDRVRACAKLNEKPISIRDFFAPTITDPELISIFDRLRAPRHLFKFLYRVVVEHCSKYTDEKPNWQIQPETLQATLALFLRDLESIDRKTGIG